MKTTTNSRKPTEEFGDPLLVQFLSQATNPIFTFLTSVFKAESPKMIIGLINNLKGCPL